MVTSICAIAKYENDYIAEWVRYHINLGFDHIYIYDNNEVDGERIEDAIPADLKGKVTVLDVRGKKYMQKIVYNECYRTYDFDWCAFIDIDEFITFNPKSGYTNIKQFLQDRDAFDAVHLNWMCYGDNGMVRKKEGGVVERFKRHKPHDFVFDNDFAQNNHVKSIVKKGLDINWTYDDDNWNSNPHTPWGINLRICNAEGDIVNNSPFHQYGFEVAYIRHYYTKTIEEYLLKIERQCADCSDIPYSFAKFYLFNRITLRKLIKQHKLCKQYGLEGKVGSIRYTVSFALKNKHPRFFAILKNLKR